MLHYNDARGLKKEDDVTKKAKGTTDYVSLSQKDFFLKKMFLKITVLLLLRRSP